MLDLIKYNNLDIEFNLVRYNYYSQAQGKESSRIKENIKILEDKLGKGVKIIPRGGVDINESCGMFVEKLK